MALIEQDVIVTTKYGKMPSFAAAPADGGPVPAVIFYMDAPGIREELRNMARRIAKAGYFCLLPDMYYRLGTLRFDLARRSDAMTTTLLAAMDHLSNDMVMDDTAGMLAWLDAQDQVKAGPLGCVGYCMSGRHITNAAALYPHRIKAAASFYGVGIVTDAEELKVAVEDNIDFIKAETLADRLVFQAIAGCEGVEHRVGDADLVLFVQVVAS